MVAPEKVRKESGRGGEKRGGDRRERVVAKEGELDISKSNNYLSPLCMTEFLPICL